MGPSIRPIEREAPIYGWQEAQLCAGAANFSQNRIVKKRHILPMLERREFMQNHACRQVTPCNDVIANDMGPKGRSTVSELHAWG